MSITTDHSGASQRPGNAEHVSSSEELRQQGGTPQGSEVSPSSGGGGGNQVDRGEHGGTANEVRDEQVTPAAQTVTRTVEATSPREDERTPQAAKANGVPSVTADTVAQTAAQQSGLAPSVDTGEGKQVQASDGEELGDMVSNDLASLNLRDSFKPVEANREIGRPKVQDAQAQIDQMNDEAEKKADGETGEKPNSDTPVMVGADEEMPEYEALGPAMPKPKPVEGIKDEEFPTDRTVKAEEMVRKRESKAKVSQKMFKGVAVYGQITNNKDVSVNHVSIGDEIIEELMRIPNNGFILYLQNFKFDSTNATVADVREFINSNNIPVGIFKSPNLEPESACEMYLSVHSGRNIELHPMAAKKFNADFDGDAVTISFKHSVVKTLPSPLKYLINLAGDLTFDMDFWPKNMTNSALDDIENVKAQFRDVTFNVRGLRGTYKTQLAKLAADVYYNGDKKSMGKFVRALARACTDEQGRLHEETMARVIDALYLECRSFQLAHLAAAEPNFIIKNLPDPVSLNDRKLYQFTEDMAQEMLVHANGAMNYADLRVMLCDYLGEEPGTNPSFRFTANIAKIFVNIDTRVQIGSEVEVGLEELLQGTLRYIESAKQSNEVFLSETAMTAKEMMKEIVLRKVGMPENYDSFGQFLDRFIRVYSANERIINASNKSLTTDFSFSQSKEKTHVKPLNEYRVKDVARVLVDIYGNFEMARFFNRFRFAIDEARASRSMRQRDAWKKDGIQFIRMVYSSDTLREFSQKNRFHVSHKELEKNNAKNVYNSRGEFALPDPALSVLYALADMRTSGASNYNTKMFTGKNSVMEDLVEVIRRINDQIERSKESLDWKQWIQDEVELVNKFDPDVFSYFHMDNTRGFLTSKYGSAMRDVVSSKNMSMESKKEMLGSIYMAMTAEYQLSRVTSKMAAIRRIEHSKRVSSRKLEKLYAEKTNAMKRLASSSPLWHTIVMEMEAGQDASMFKALKTGNPGGINKYYNGWRDGSLKDYRSVVDVLLSVELTHQQKNDILADVMRTVEKFPYFDSYEVPIMLHHGPAQNYSTLPPSSTGVMETINDFASSYNGMLKRSYYELLSQVKAAREMCGGDDSIFAALNTFAQHPEMMIRLDSETFSDVLCSTLEKVYPQSEKSKQHPWTNAFYSMMSYVRNWGFFSDVYRTDDKPLGLLASDSISEYDIVSVLADPNKVITTYTPQGQIVKLSRESIMGTANPSASEMWDFFEKNPRIAGCLRIHRAAVTSDGNGFLGSVGTIYDAIDESKMYKETDMARARVQRKLYDDPRYAALVAVLAPTAGRSVRNLRHDYRDIDVSLRKELAYVSVNGYSVKDELEILHLTTDDFKHAGMTEEAAVKLSADISESIEYFVNEFKEDFEQCGYSFDNLYAFEEKRDLSACYAYYDVRQELTGSKTEVSTGVEGSETWKLAGFIALLNPKDKYADLHALEDIGDIDHHMLIEKFGECMTSLGKPVNMLTEEELSNDEIVVEAPEGFTVPDKTLDRYGRQVSSACSYLIVKRDNGAEKFNLKAKKTGLDKYHSVTKHGKFYDEKELAQFDYQTADYAQIVERVKEIADTEGMFAAKLWLAKRLKTANNSIGYDEMTLANFMSLADLMIVQDEESGEIRVRSIEMIARSIKSHITNEMVNRGKLAELREAAEAGNAMAGTESNDVASVLANIRPRASVSDHSGLLRPRSSSWTRNYDLLKRICRQVRKPVASLKETGKAKKAAYDAAQRKQGGNPLDAMSDSRAGYDFVGYNDTVSLAPGPSNAWYLDDGNMTDEEVVGIMRQAYRYGMTVVMPIEFAANANLGELGKDLIPFPDVQGYVMLPFFDMRLNGSEAFSSPATFGVFRRPADNIVWTYEDSTQEYGLGDAGIQLFKNFVDRIHINWKDSTEIQFGMLFANVYEENPDAQFKITMADKNDLKRIMNPAYDCELDVGVAPAGRGFDDHWEITMNAIDEYVRDFPEFSDNDGIRKEAKPGDVIGFAKCVVYPGDGSKSKTVYAPIVPFDLQGTNGVSREYVPSHFRIESKHIEPDSTPMESVFKMSWVYDDGLTGHTLKVFEGQGAASKMLGAVNQAVKGFALKTRQMLDACYARESTTSRRVGTNKRIGTLQTLMFTARTQGYNFAEVKDAFPGDPVLLDGKTRLKDALLHGPVPLIEWNALIDEDFKWHDDATINAFLKREISKFMENGGNPSDFLASQYDGAFTDVWWEFECMFEVSQRYQDGLMAWLNSMNEKLCAASTEDHSGDYYFKCMGPADTSDKWMVNCMAMEVPHRNPVDDTVFYLWENVYAGWSFVNFNDFSGAHRINVNGASNALDAISTIALAGNMPPRKTLREWMGMFMSDRGEVGDPVSILELDDNAPFARQVDLAELLDGKETTEVEVGKPSSFDKSKYGKVLALTGHRPDKLWGYDTDDVDEYRKVADDLAKYCKDNGIDTIISGMAEGFDTIGAQVAIDNGLHLVCAVPFSGQEKVWPQSAQEKYKDILSKADEVVIVSDGGYRKDKYNARNQWMIDNADEVYVLFDGTPGGTADAMRRVEKAGVPVHAVDPNIYGETDNVDPKRDGIDFINVYSRGNTKLGRFLSNMYYAPIDTPYGRFDTIEGYWHYLALPDTCPDKEQLMTADGFHARKIGQALREQYGTVQRDDFETLISSALLEKLSSYTDDWVEEYGKMDNLPLKHYYVSSNGKTVNLTRRYKWMLDLLDMHMKNIYDDTQEMLRLMQVEAQSAQRAYDELLRRRARDTSSHVQ